MYNFVEDEDLNQLTTSILNKWDVDCESLELDDCLTFDSLAESIASAYNAKSNK